MKLCTIFLLCSLILVPEILTAGERADVVMPDTVQIGGTTLLLNGMGLRKKLWVKVYVGGLYLEEKTDDPETIIAGGGAWRVVMHFLHSKVGLDKLNGAWREGFEKNAPWIFENHADEVDRFLTFFREVVKGEEIVITFLPEDGLTVEIGGEVTGHIIPVEFASALMSVWLGPEPPSDDLKEGMLGLRD